MCVADSVSVHITPILLLVYMKLKSDSVNLFFRMAIVNELLHEMNMYRVTNT